MNLDKYFVCFDSALPSRICDDLVSYGEQQASQVALIGEQKEPPKDISKLYKTRNSSIVWMDEPWIYNAILPIVAEANRHANWNFEYQRAEACQWTKYSETQHYTWHQDASNKPCNEEPFNNSTLSFLPMFFKNCVLFFKGLPTPEDVTSREKSSSSLSK